ncbi:uncharacterized protein LOC123864424 [Maniola jurtina]|uniref:uncharacterized protein LOC123864424 n=1 Tax=Maniola jurtina TaxID=191418 RepID=UPI001E687500|nr:uncharacterized protein LOC123864424 [Maniola jurtina]
MRTLCCSLVILVIINNANSVKVNIEGTVSLGKDVMDILTQFLSSSYLSGRRSLVPVPEDPIVVIVRTAVLCRNLAFCQHLRNFVEEYLAVLAMSLKTVLNQMLSENVNDITFEQQLKHYLEITSNILEHANTKVTEDNKVYYWIDTIKKICARFQEMASIFVMEKLQANPKQVNKIKDELNRKLIIATVLVEMKYQTKLCKEYSICIKSYEVTKSLNTLLEIFKTTQDDKVRLFIKYFYETLFDTAFYTHLNENTAHELQIILNDMAYSSEVPTKELLLTVQKIVEARLKAIETNNDLKMTHDALLVHVILSDMDHIYSVHKSDQFKQFFQHFYNWLVSDVTMGKVIRQVVKDVSAELKTAPDDILVKIINEVKAFLEITVEAENRSL